MKCWTVGVCKSDVSKWPHNIRITPTLINNVTMNTSKKIDACNDMQWWVRDNYFIAVPGIGTVGRVVSCKTFKTHCFFFKNGPTPASFIIYFRSFQSNIISIFTTNICEKCPSSTWCQDSNPWRLEHESPPITTRPGLATNTVFCWLGHLMMSFYKT